MLSKNDYGHHTRDYALDRAPLNPLYFLRLVLDAHLGIISFELGFSYIGFLPCAKVLP